MDLTIEAELMFRLNKLIQYFELVMDLKKSIQSISKS